MEFRKCLVLALSLQLVLGLVISKNVNVYQNDEPQNDADRLFNEGLKQTKRWAKENPFHRKIVGPPHLDCMPPTCTPECGNGGTCTATNFCQCKNGFKGPRCEYGAEVCNLKNIGFNGNYNCLSYTHKTTCKLTCPGKYKLTGPPASVYECVFTEGQFVPPIPSCNYPKGTKPIIKYHELGEKPNPNPQFDGTIETPIIYPLYNNMPTTQSAICSTWSGANVKTFDGTVFKAPLSCSHTLIRIEKIAFEIVLKACVFESRHNCPHTLKILSEGILFTLKNFDDELRLFTKEKQLPLNVNMKGMKVQLVGRNLQINFDRLGLTLIWDKHQYIGIQASNKLQKHLGGICGSFDGDSTNDFIPHNGVLLKTGKAFVDSWKVVDESPECMADKTCDVNFSKKCERNQYTKAQSVCKALLEYDKMAECVKPFNMDALMKACVSEYCNCENKAAPQLCSCETIAMLIKECDFRGVKVQRASPICPINLSKFWNLSALEIKSVEILKENNSEDFVDTDEKTETVAEYMDDMENTETAQFVTIDLEFECTSGMVYSACGPPVQPACGAIEIDKTDACVEGCFCPDDTIRFKNTCVALEKCPCVYGTKEFAPGAQIKKLCNRCTCKEGFWECTTKDCSSRCTACGDPHYKSFDGKTFNFMGKSSYYLLKTDEVTVEAKNTGCNGHLPSCTTSLTIVANLYGTKTIIKFEQKMVTYVNGKQIDRFPKLIQFGQIIIRKASSRSMTATFSNGIRVSWDGEYAVHVDVPQAYFEKTSGLCGKLNANKQDDFLTPEGDVEGNPNAFGNKWNVKDTAGYLSDDNQLTTEDTADYLSDEEDQSHPCKTNPQMQEVADKYCKLLWNEIFIDCRDHVDFESYYNNCEYDVCACDGDPLTCFCPIIASYGEECNRQGITTGWRNNITECAIKCPAGQIYVECGDSCRLTCEDIAITSTTCEFPCVEGCRCPDGQYFNDEDECVPANECPCTYEEVSFNTGYKEVRRGKDKLDLCTCEGGNWKCNTAEPEDSKKYPSYFEVKSQCTNKSFAEFSTCVPTEPKTCRNMHSYVENLKECKHGCACKEGYVYDGTIKQCISPEDCSCHHGGKRFSKGNQITEDCNVCLCESGKWNCTTNECDATCSVWGDSHFTTFDNYDFDFQGACDYILSKGVAANGDSFSITIQNVLCGTLGVTCSKSLQIALNGTITDTIILSEDSSYLDYESKSLISKLQEQSGNKGHAYSIYKAGLFIVLEIIPLKLQVKWDEGTRVYVRLSKDWKGKVNGLCGNFNKNANDDMKTPSQGVQVNSLHFGHSWKLHDFCAAPTEQIDSCKEHPERATWAQRKCEILKSSLFKECNLEVPVEKYLKRCIFDTCACDQGGDCECLCTAIAAYAHACSMKGISVRWRTKHLCPMQCDMHWSEYDACTPVCAIETCDNFLDQAITDRICLSENCIEGCQIKPCDEGMIYLNDSFTQCVPKSKCKPFCMQKDDKIFYEADMTYADECQTCWCTKKKEVCSGVPCVKKLPPIESSPNVKTQKMKTVQKCTTGWTSWFNQDRGSTETNQTLKLNDEEKLPKFDRFERIYGTCAKEFMKKIECRVVNTHERPGLMEEKVSCTLEAGLTCTGNCHDYEIRVFCQCEDMAEMDTLVGKSCNIAMEEYKAYPGDCYKFLHCQSITHGRWEYVEKTCGPTMMFHPVRHICDHIATVQLMKPDCNEELEPTKPTKLLCPADKVWSECAYHCEQSCHFYRNSLEKRGLCNIGDLCKGGCIDESEPNCQALNKFWRDKNTCVDIDQCPCMNNDEEYVKPHSIFKQNISQTCQCIENTFLCEGYAEFKEIVTPIPVIHRKPSTEKAFIVPIAKRPPPECDPELVDLVIDGDYPLPDSVFSASSILSDSYLPHFGRLHTKPIGESEGCWSPLNNDQMQYLQVAFNKPLPLFGVIMQGSPTADQYVTLFKILYIYDGEVFLDLVDETDKPQLFNGPSDPRTPVELLFKVPIEAKVVRIYPLEWHGSIAIRTELLGCIPLLNTITEKPSKKFFVTTEDPNILAMTTPIWEPTPEYTDPMGVESGAIHTSQVKASSIWPQSVKVKKVDLLDMLKLSSSMSWKPVLNSPSAYVEFDFLEPRNISGITTKGGTDGWVTDYKVVYSNNAFVWNSILAPDGNLKIFVGNHNPDTPQTNYFRYPIQTQMLRVMPVKWKRSINMRIELLGSFLPYRKIKEKTDANKTNPDHCLVCANLVLSPNDNECKCNETLLWDGFKCVDQHECPCIENFISYPVGSKFENNDCQECVCVLGGVKHCQPKKCQTCDSGLRITQTSSCTCKCEPCPKMYKLCSSSGDCIPESSSCIEEVGESTTEMNPYMETDTTTEMDSRDNDNSVQKGQCYDRIHSPGETWQRDKCTECKCNKDAQTECIQQQCPMLDSICPENFIPSKISSAEECCPKIICECKPVSECEPLQEDIPLKPGEKLVKDSSGCCPIQKIVCDTKTCPAVASECENKFYELKVVTHLGDCCPTVLCTPPKDACIIEVDGITTLKHSGDKWNVPENPCLQKVCAKGLSNTLQINEITEKCSTDCPKGYEYKHLESTKCCGSCTQTKCVFNGNLHAPGDQWLSSDNCTTYSCINADDQFLISSSKDVCPDASGCPPDRLEHQGCCKICKPIPENNCLPISLSEDGTKKMVKIATTEHGVCINEEPILGFTVCKGFCESESKYNADSLKQDSVCSYCSIESFKNMSVPMSCEDGHTILKDIEIPSSCGCNACLDAARSKLNL